MCIGIVGDALNVAFKKIEIINFYLLCGTGRYRSFVELIICCAMALVYVCICVLIYKT